MAADLEGLKATLAEAKSLHRDAVKVVLGAKRVAAAARFNVNVARRAYINALPSRPKRLSAQEAEDVEAVFADTARTRTA